MGIDADNKKAIEEICTYNGKKTSLEQLAKWTLVEQHSDAPDKAHIYIYSRKPFAKKSTDKRSDATFNAKLENNEIPAIEVKSEGSHGIFFCTPSIHKNGYPYQILDTRDPILAEDFEQHIENICRKYGIKYLNNSSSTQNSLIPIKDLFNEDTKILEGHNRHEALLRVMESLLKRTRGILSFEQVKEFCKRWNEQHCAPPLNNKEFEKQWHDATKYIDRILAEQNGNESYDDEIIEERKKHKVILYKYSKSGALHESIIVAGIPAFFYYDRGFKIIDKIEEDNRIIIPSNHEEYPYEPYEFSAFNELCTYYFDRAKTETIDTLYQKAKSIVSKYNDQDENVITLLAADIILSYFQDLFPTIHYLDIVGDNDTGKSSLGNTFEYTGYRPIKGTSITAANYYRVLGTIEAGQCTIIEDEADHIEDDPDKMRILKSGYEYNAKIPRINMNTEQQTQNWYYAYSFKIIIAERSLDHYKARGLKDRSFLVHCKPGRPKYTIKQIITNDRTRKGLYHELMDFRKLMLCYRMLHYSDILPNISTGLKNRDDELCRPLLQLFYDSKSLKEIIKCLETFLREKKESKSNSLESALYSIIVDLVATRGYEISVRLIWGTLIEKVEGVYDEQNKPNQFQTLEYGTIYKNTITRIIVDKFCSNSGRKRTNTETVLLFDQDKITRFANAYDTSVNVNVTIQLEHESGGSVSSVNIPSVSSVSIPGCVNIDRENTSGSRSESGGSVSSVSIPGCVGTAIQVYHDKIQLYCPPFSIGCNNNKNGQIHTLRLEPSLLTLSTRSINDVKSFSHSAEQPSTDYRTHPAKPSQLTLPSQPSTASAAKTHPLKPSQLTLPSLSLQHWFDERKPGIEQIQPIPENNTIPEQPSTVTAAAKTIYRIHPHSDIFACENCRRKGDKWDMQVHQCRGNKK